MPEIFASAGFWFGAVILLVYQGARFSELGSVDDVTAKRLSAIPNLRANDFSGPRAFYSALITFLLATLIIFFLTCWVSPSIIEGWAVISGQEVDGNIIGSVPYPVYIAALYMGLTQPAIPILSNLASLQKDIFHFFLGVPKRIIATSDFIFNQILARSPRLEDLKSEVDRLISDQWIVMFDRYADAVFYREQLRRLGVGTSDGVSEISKGSVRELKSVVDQLVFSAAVATVRESGGRALEVLASDLRVKMPPEEKSGTRLIVPGALLCLAATVILWFVLPLVSELQSAAGVSLSMFWPTTPSSSGVYIFAQIIPVLTTTLIILYKWPRMHLQKTEPSPESIFGTFERSAPLFILIFGLVIVFDYAQMLSDLGSSDGGELTEETTPLALLMEWAPYHMLHALISVWTSVVVLDYLQSSDFSSKTSWRRSCAMVIGGTAILASLYAVARLAYQFEVPVSAYLDYVILLIFLNGVAGVLGLLAAYIAVHSARKSGSCRVTPVVPSALES